MEIVSPDRVDTQAALVPWAQVARVVLVRLGDQDARVQLGQFGQDVFGRCVEDGVRRVEAQAVDVVLAEPVPGIVEHELAHPLTVRPVVVDRIAPGRVIAIGEVVVRERPQVIAVRPEVVVDDIQDDGQPVLVGGVDKAFEAVWAAVHVAGREQVDAVIAPVARARELGNWQRLERRHAKRRQPRHLLDRAVEGAVECKRADVELIDHLAPDRGDWPVLVVPDEGVRFDHLGWTVRSIGLRTRVRIGIAGVAVQSKAIARAWADALDAACPGAVVTPFERRPTAAHFDVDLVRLGRTDAEAHSARPDLRPQVHERGREAQAMCHYSSTD